jgi:hypothetical protein
MGLRSCDPFDVPVPADLAAAIARVRALVVGEGGAFTGDVKAGRFAGPTPMGTVEGRYTVHGDAIRITITSKPMVAPCGVLESKIRGYFV